MLEKRPAITHHAYARAKTRLGLSALAFDAWCDATWRDWLQVDYTYLLQQNLKCSANCYHFITPWSIRFSAALAISYDNAILTVMTFTGSNEQRSSLRDDPARDAVVKLIDDGQLDPLWAINKAINGSGIERLRAAGLDEAIGAYLSGTIHFFDFRDVLHANPAKRKDLLAESMQRASRKMG